MADTDRDSAADPGILAKSGRPSGAGRGGQTAAILTVLWLGTAGWYFLLGPGAGAGETGGVRGAVALLTLAVPVGLIWLADAFARFRREVRAEMARLHLALDALRQAQPTAQKAAAQPASPDLLRQLGEIAEAQRKTETALATFISIRPQAPSPPPAPRVAAAADPDDQASLALGTPAEAISPPVGTADFIAALQFPESPDDKEGFRAMRRALQDRAAAQLIQAAQDVLTLLSQDGIYMDDLKPDRARPETWRKFAQGERGRAVASLGGIHDRSSLALSAARMRNDTIFRDACHHFLRKFDHTFVGFEQNASDADIVALADTRTARAFMLLGRAAGTFD